MTANFSVLLIETDCVETQVQKIMLTPEKFKVIHKTDSTSAWNFLREVNILDLIIFNINTPNSSFFSISYEKLLDSINSQYQLRNVPIILITDASMSTKEVLQKIAKKSDAIILSPFNPIRFMKEVNRLVTKGIGLHIEEIHEQHMSLAKRINQLMELTGESKDIVHKIEQVMILKQLTFEHFDMEESYMLSHNYPDYQQHYDNHDVMRNTLRMLLKNPQERINKGEIENFYRSMFNDLSDDEQYIHFLDEIKITEI
ncbi:MAG: hypothetical protein HQL46_11245 [Gammaproteobacteria bacterium]|nr:hypothetical protein [Gammaproteobacteria bacterium]